MKKKIIGAIIVVLGCALLFVFGSVLIMFLAPGTEIFGIRYVASGTSKCENPNKTLEAFSGDIYIDTKNVPITINFTDGYAYAVDFCQNFIGFTKTKEKVADLSIEKKNDGKDLYITAKEIEEFIYSQKADQFFRFDLYLPQSFFSSGTRSINIKSKSSSVKILGRANLNNFTMDSTGGLTVPEESKLTVADQIKIKSSKLIDLGTNVTCHTCNLESTGNSINVANPIPGDIVAKTKGGDLKFTSCKNLTFTSKSGSVKAYGNVENVAEEKVNIKTNGGSVSLGKVNTNISVSSTLFEDMTNIKTEGGAISINQMIGGVLTSTRGKITVSNASNLLINSKTGNVIVKNITDKITVKGKNGKVALGEGGTIANADVSTTTGAIFAYNVTGNVTLYSKSNDVTFENLSSENINLHSGKKLVAKNLMGKVEAYSRADGKYTFTKVSGDVNITSGTRADHITIELPNSKAGTFDYSLKSTKGTKAKVYVGETLTAELSNIESTITEGHFLIKVETPYGEIVLKMAE